jgi:LmbE family N-acetylglucosaminyl deacetylase
MSERTLGEPARPRPDQDISRVLVVAAHPDDADFGAAGTIARWVDAGLTVTILLCTHGEQGGFEDTNRKQIPTIREREQIAASAALGVEDVRFLEGHRDGWLEPSWELQRQIVEVIRDVQPQRVLIQSPQRWYDRVQASHPDHLAAGEAAIRAIYPASENRYAWPELIERGLEPWHVNEIWIMAHPESTHVVDITDTFARKVQALAAHTSQTEHMGDQLEGLLRGWGSGVGEAFQLGPGRLGESFHIMDLG